MSSQKQFMTKSSLFGGFNAISVPLFYTPQRRPNTTTTAQRCQSKPLTKLRSVKGTEHIKDHHQTLIRTKNKNHEISYALNDGENCWGYRKR